MLRSESTLSRIDSVHFPVSSKRRVAHGLLSECHGRPDCVDGLLCGVSGFGRVDVRQRVPQPHEPSDSGSLMDMITLNPFS